VRRELPDHVIVLNQQAPEKIAEEYVPYYHEDRTHLGLGKDTPGGRVAASAPSSASEIISLPRLGGCTPVVGERFSAAQTTWRRGGDSKNTKISNSEPLNQLATNFPIYNRLLTFTAVTLNFCSFSFWLKFHQKRYHWYHLLKMG
jgi:hypothetical protein